MAILPTAKCGLICNTICFFYFAIFGMAFLMIAINMNEVRLRYDDKCGTAQICVINFTLDNEIHGPIFLYYELSDFHSNHKLYTK